MPNFEEDTYSIIFASLKHPIRRKILRMLSERPRGFSDMQQAFGIESSHLTYHLESLANLIFKTEYGKYALSSPGEAAASMMRGVEGEQPKTLLRLTFLSKRWKVLFIGLFMALILICGLCFFQYRTLSQLSGQYARLRAEHELVLEALRGALDLDNFFLTHEYSENGSVVSPLLGKSSFGIMGSLYGWSINNYAVYSLTSNFTLEIKISFTSPLPPNAFLDIIIFESSNETGSHFTMIRPNASQQAYWSPLHYYYPGFVGVWGMMTTQTGICTEVTLSRGGQYNVLINAPNAQAPEELFERNYTMTLRIRSQGEYVPFFVLRGFRRSNEFCHWHSSN